MVNIYQLLAELDWADRRAILLAILVCEIKGRPIHGDILKEVLENIRDDWKASLIGAETKQLH